MLKQTYNEHLEEVLSDIRLIYMHSYICISENEDLT